MHINCYAAGDIVSRKTTTDVGGLNGRSGGIAVDDNCYFNSEALQKQGDTVNAPAVAVGVNANDSALLKNVSGKTKAELGRLLCALGKGQKLNRPSGRRQKGRRHKKRPRMQLHPGDRFAVLGHPFMPGIRSRMVLLSLTVTVQAAECVVPSAPVICRITLVEPAAAAVAVTE